MDGIEVGENIGNIHDGKFTGKQAEDRGSSHEVSVLWAKLALVLVAELVTIMGTAGDVGCATKSANPDKKIRCRDRGLKRLWMTVMKMKSVG